VKEHSKKRLVRFLSNEGLLKNKAVCDVQERKRTGKPERGWRTLGKLIKGEKLIGFERSVGHTHPGGPCREQKGGKRRKDET